MAGNSTLDFIMRTRKEGRGAEETATAFKDLKGGLGDAFQALTGSSLSAAAGVGLAVAAVGGMMKGAMEAEKVQADLNATLASTHGAAGISADEINRMANALSDATGMEDDAIVKGQNMLLTFTAIGKDVFPMATETMANMAVKFGNMDSAAVQLGKALQDPVKGVSALREVGVALSAQQEKQVRDFVAMGDVASAQKVILKELNTEFGGLARAMGDTTEGKINKLKNSLDNLGESIGAKLLPPLGEAADALNLLLTGNQKIADALEQHKGDVEKISTSYKDYITELQRAAGVTGQQVDAQGNLVEVSYNYGRAITTVRQENWALTESEWNKKYALDDTAESLKNAPFRYDNFSQSMDGATTSTLALNTAQADQSSLISRLNTEMQSYTTQLFYNQAAAGLDAAGQRALAEAMGLIDPTTAAALTALDNLKWQLENGAIDADTYARRVAELDRNIGNLQSKDITITTTMITKYHSEEEGSTRHGGERYAEGGSFIIPPGYSNDNYPVKFYASSGERVTITPADGGAAAGAAVQITGDVYMRSNEDIEMLARRITEIQRARRM